MIPNNADSEYIKALLKEIAFLKQKNLALEEELNRYKNRNSRNSSTPPSHDFKKNSSKHVNLGGAKPGHQVHHRKIIPEHKVDKFVTCKTTACPSCGGKIRETTKESLLQYIDLVCGKLFITNYQRAGYYCRHCRRRFFAPLPNKIGNSPFGPRLRAAVCTLTARYHLSKREVPALFRDFFDFYISDGMVSKIEASAANTLKPYYQKIRKAIVNRRNPVYVDETGWRHARRNAYLWEMSTNTHTLYHIHFHRNKAARDELLGKKFCLPIVTDRYCVYRSLCVPHQYCLSHLLRNFQSFAESPTISSVIGRGLVSELKSVFRLWRLYCQGKLSFDELKSKCTYRRRNIKDWLKDGVFSCSTRLSRFSWTLLGDYDRIWTFLRVPHMNPTNNQAERDLRPMVLWRKKSFGTKGDTGLQFVSIVGSITQTLKKQKRRVFCFLSQALEKPEVLQTI